LTPPTGEVDSAAEHVDAKTVPLPSRPLTKKEARDLWDWSDKERQKTEQLMKEAEKEWQELITNHPELLPLLPPPPPTNKKP
jgi:hypothetical protein